MHLDDDSQAKRDEEILLQLSAQLKATLEATSDGILVLDQSGSFINMNHRFSDMWEIPQQTVESGSEEIAEWMTRNLVDPDQLLHIKALLKTGLTDTPVTTLELTNGKIFELRIYPQVISGKQSGMVMNFHDITETRRYEEALIEEREKAHFANRSKTDFLSSMSHELRTPMNAILGFAQIMKLEIDDDNDLSDSLDEIMTAGQHLLKLINEVLDLAKVESGRLKVNLENLSINEAISNSINMVSSIATTNNITIHHTPAEDITVQADSLRLGQSIINLLSNAIKYNRPEGSVTIKTEADDQFIRILVQDTGYGISAANMEKLFEPFERLEAENSDIEGTGIGLTLTRRIIELMKGELSVESTVGQGSTFCIALPARQNIETDSEQQQSLNNLFQQVSKAPAKASTVLYIEDNLANTRLVQKLLTKRPYIELLTTQDPHAGLQLAAEHKPELILTDIGLPGIDGFEVLKRLRDNPAFAGTPVVAITARAMQSDVNQLQSAGFDDYLLKPVDIAKFFKVIDQYTA